MLVNHTVMIFLPLFLILNLVAAIQRAPINVGEGTLQERQLFRNSTKLIWGLFRSRNIISLLGHIPCEIVQILENDENEADRFFNQIQSGEVPSLIESLPGEITDRIVDIVGIALTLPSDIFEGAEAIVSDTVEFFNAIEDGSIVERLQEVPGMIVSQFTSGWDDFTSGFGGVIDVLTCAFVHCATTEPAGVCLNTNTYSGENSTTADTGATPTFSSSWSESPTPNPSWGPTPTPSLSPTPIPSWSPSPTPPRTYVPSSTAGEVVTAGPNRSQTPTALPTAQATEELTGLAAPMQLSLKAAEASLIAALLGIIGVVQLL
ncbi:hypothetical protein GJ744_006217 [Endocarpon pusillum]|uniref:Uncharacterized protein n=1 Tax=Endocarpon pusillum TaxID=364733 RepID=A0A8H7AT02_9EURO|nr:hypothetical protein GJ744_006217 [Endocarpon pusillum]